MKYKKLGKLPPETIEFFKQELLARKIDSDYQWIQFDQYLNDAFKEIFTNTELKIQYDTTKSRLVQKAFYSAPGHGFRIHKDGIRCRAALNIAISCNDTDWVRWYDDNTIKSLEDNTPITNRSGSGYGYSRNCSIQEYENIPFTHELQNEVGDVYALDVDTFHSFKCIGSEPRIIIQTKFEGFPTFNTIAESLSRNSFKNLIRSSYQV
jgi:hypothetical protein